MKYIVKAHETFFYNREVEANSPDEAIAYVKENGLDEWLEWQDDTSDWHIDSVTESN
jgi:hypothetical protein